MENRFGVKDLILFTLIVALIVLVILAMVQYDRQFDRVVRIQDQQRELAADITRVKRQVADLADSGIAIAPAGGGGSPTTSATTRPAANTWTYLKRAEQMPGFARGGWFLDNFGTKIGKITPLISTDVYAAWVEQQVMETLAQRDPYTLDYVPRLARRWEISPDGLTMTFHLNENATFSDGHPLTAEDVVFTFDWIRNPDVNCPRVRAYLTQLKDVKKLDDYTVQFTFTEPYFKNFESAAAQSILPKHFYSKFTPNQFNEKTGLLMGSGPYMLEDPVNWAPGNGVTLLRNPRYWNAPPTFDRINFSEIQEESAEMVQYGNQEHDLIRCTPEQYTKLINDPRIMSFSDSYRYQSPYSGYSYIGWNQRRMNAGKPVPTRFSDKRVRQAMTMLIDRERMAREIFLGYATVACGPFAPNGPQSDPSVKPWPYDVDAARKLLAEAGFEDRDHDGVLESADGQPFRFKLTYPGGAQTYEKIVLFLRDNFARGGIVMEPDRQDWPVLLNHLSHSDFDAVILGWSSVPESDPFQEFHSSQIAGEGDNRTAYINPELDKTIEEARRTMDTAKRMQLWHKVHRILHEDQPYTFMFNRDALKLINKRIHNVEKSAVGLNFEYLNGGMIPWFIPTDEQQRHQR